MHAGSKRYSRKNAPPVRTAASSNAWSSAMFSGPERPAGQMERWNDGVSVSSECIGLHRRAHTDQIAVPVGAVHAAHRRPHLVLAGPDGGGRPAPARGGAGPHAGGHLPPRVGGGREGGVSAGVPPPPPPPEFCAGPAV